MDKQKILHTFHELTSSDFLKLSCFLVLNNRKEITDTFNPFPFTKATAEFITLKPKMDKYYGCFVGDALIGFSMLRGWDEGYSEPSFGIVIGYQFQRLGYGKLLLQYTIQQAQNMDCESIRLSVLEDNQVAFHLYQKAGFEVFKKQTVQINHNQRIRILMRLRLSKA